MQKTSKNKSKQDEGVILGFDISTSVIGITCLSKLTGNVVFIEPIIYASSNKEFDIWDKSSYFKVAFLELLKKYNIKIENIVDVAFEDFAKKFTGGSSSISTIITLAQFNCLVQNVIRELLDIKPEMLNVNSIRKDVGIKINKQDSRNKKEQIVEQVVELVKRENIDPWVWKEMSRGKDKGKIKLHECNGDMADSWVVAKALWKRKYCS